MRLFFTVVIASLSLNAFGQVPDDLPHEGLVGWWNFDGQYQDQNGSDMMFQTNGSTSLGEDRFGQTDSAVQFFGDGSAVASNDGSVQQYGELSLSYWVKMQSVDAAVVALGASNGVSWTSWFGSDCGIYYASGCGDSFDAFAEEALLSESGSFQEEWHHVVMTSQGLGEQFSVYIDGELFGSAISATGGSCYNTSIHLGVEIWSAPEYMTGYIDELGIWNRQLTPEEVTQIYGLSSTSGCTDSTACNYNENASDDDGSCDYSCCPGPGCCGVGMNWNSEIGECEITNPTDSNLDGCTDLNDLMDLLAAYGDCAMVETNYSLSFDGADDFVDFNSEILYGNPSHLSKALWVKTSNSGEYGGVLLTKRHTSWFADSHTLRLSNGHLIFSEDCAASNEGTENTLNTFISDNNWHFIVAVKDNNLYSIYVDGVLVASNTMNNDCANWSNLNLYLGYHGGWGSVGMQTFFQGLVDNVSIWETALSEQQIQSYMSTPPTGNEEGLVGYWDFNEGTGSTLTDQTSNGNDGVINGATWSTNVPTAP